MKSIVIFGAGRLGFDFFFRMRKQYNIIAFWDNDPELWGKTIYDVPIMQICPLEKIGAEEVYISVHGHRDEIIAQLNNMGIFSIMEPEERKEKPRYDLKNVRMPYARMIQRAYEQTRITEYNRRWKNICEKYRKVYVYFIDEDSVGEMIGRIGIIFWNLRVRDDSLVVFLPLIYVTLVNIELIRLLNQKIYIPYGEDLLFWEYIFMEHFDEIEHEDMFKFNIRHNYPNYLVKEYEHGLLFDAEKEKKARARMYAMDIKKRYVCLAARNSNYYNSIGREGSEVQTYRDASFSLYDLTTSELIKFDVQTVRMGRGEKCELQGFENCIDYAFNDPDDFMDLFLIANSLFMITGPSGIRLIAALFHVPVLMVNSVHISFGWGGTQITPFDMFVPKKYFDIKKNRYLSLLEIAEFENHYLDRGGISVDCGVRFENNSREEIRDAGIEMLERLQGKWTDLPGDKEDLDRFWEISDKMKMIALSNDKNHWGCGFDNRIPATYLRNNRYLLEM